MRERGLLFVVEWIMLIIVEVKRTLQEEKSQADACASWGTLAPVGGIGTYKRAPAGGRIAYPDQGVTS